MAYSKIIHTKSEAVGAAPIANSLSYGEIAINYSDGHLYIKKADNTVKKVASTDFPLQINSLRNDVDSINSTIEFVNLRFTAATDLDYGRLNVNTDSSHDSLTYGLANQITSDTEDSMAFGISNIVNAQPSTPNESPHAIAIGIHNQATGPGSIAIGSYVKTPTRVVELGQWSNDGSRLSSVRIANENVAMTLRNSNTAIAASTVGGNDGEESLTELPRNMYCIRRSEVTQPDTSILNEILIDINIDGTVETCVIGTASALRSPDPVRNIGLDALTGEVLVKTIRSISQSQYDQIVLNNEIDNFTLYIVD
jgi:hypothetical protein